MGFGYFFLPFCVSSFLSAEQFADNAAIYLAKRGEEGLWIKTTVPTNSNLDSSSTNTRCLIRTMIARCLSPTVRPRFRSRSRRRQPPGHVDVHSPPPSPPGDARKDSRAGCAPPEAPVAQTSGAPTPRTPQTAGDAALAAVAGGRCCCYVAGAFVV